MKAAAQQLVVEQIPIAKIQPSPTNPRKHYDQAALEELAASIKSVGVQVPLSLRILASAKAVEPPFEIVGGERRWRAAQIAGITSVPAIVRVMTDAECREAQLIDNLQRADLSPMEEAEGYELLIREASAEGFAITDEQLAAKVGKPLGHVRSRRKLLELIPEARTGLAEGFITFGCALLIAKLQPADQDKATVRALNIHTDGNAADALKALREEIADNKEWAAKQPDDDDYDDHFAPISESFLKAWIADKVTLDLAKASWPLDQPIEGVDAPACQACPKRSGSDTALFAELTAKADVCTDPECFAAKRKMFVHITASVAKESGAPLLKLSTKTGYGAIKPEQKQYKSGQWLAADPESCAYVQRGITEEGQVLTVCVDPKCKTHKHHLLAGSSTAGAPKTDWEAERKKQEESRRAYVAKETPIRTAVRAAIVPKLKGPKLLRAVVRALMLEGRHYSGLAILRGLPVKSWEQDQRSVIAAFEKAKDADLEGWVVDAVMAGGIVPREHMHDEPKRDREDLWALGKLVGVDCDAIAKKATKPVTKAAAAKKAEKKAPVKPAKNGQRAPKKKLSAEARKRIADAMKKRWAKAQAVRK